MNFRNFSILFFLIFPFILTAQENPLIVVGDSLVGRTIDGESIREVHGNVVMTQGDIRITCNKAIQYIARNEAELIGKVVVIQDSIIINTDLGYYFGDTKIASSEVGVTLFDGHVNLKSKKGGYYFDEKKALFTDDVVLIDNVSTLTTDKLTYFNDEDRAVAVGNVKIVDSATVVYADSLEHNRNNKNTFAFNHVRIYDSSNKLAIFGNNFEDYGDTNYSRIFGEPLLIKIDTTDSGNLDTLFVRSRIMEAYGDSTKRLIAIDSVKIVRGEFASVSGYAEFYQLKDEIYTYKRETDSNAPVLWNENAQLIGDSVFIRLKNNRLDYMKIISDASIISKQENYEMKYDQISGKVIELFFDEDGLIRTEVEGNALSIYYMYEDDEPNGLLKSSSEKAKIFFDNKKVSEVKLFDNPQSEYHPENMIEGKEKEFTIPTFRIFDDRPTKEKIAAQKLYLISTLKTEFENGRE